MACLQGDERQPYFDRRYSKESQHIFLKTASKECTPNLEKSLKKILKAIFVKLLTFTSELGKIDINILGDCCSFKLIHNYCCRCKIHKLCLTITIIMCKVMFGYVTK